MRKESKVKNRFVLSLNTSLCYLLIATLMFTSVSFARYITTVQGGDSFRVVAFVADAAGEGNENLTIDCGNPELMSAEYKVHVMNYQGERVSDVAAEYWIEVKLPEKLPEGVIMELYHGENRIAPVVQENVFIYRGAKQFAASKAEMDSYVLKFVVENPELLGEDKSITGIQVIVIAEQID